LIITLQNTSTVLIYFIYFCYIYIIYSSRYLVPIEIWHTYLSIIILKMYSINFIHFKFCIILYFRQNYIIFLKKHHGLFSSGFPFYIFYIIVQFIAIYNQVDSNRTSILQSLKYWLSESRFDNMSGAHFCITCTGTLTLFSVAGNENINKMNT